MVTDDVDAVAYDAIVLAGGRSSRMAGVDKLGLVVDGRALVTHACAAVRTARRLYVVGPDDLAGLPVGVPTVREDPPFSGPAAAIGAGLAAIGRDVLDLVVVVAADVPRVAEAVPPLLAAIAARPAVDGVVARSSDGHRQPLIAVYRSAALQAALDAHAPLTDLGVGRVTAGLDLDAVDLPDGVIADIDTPADLQRLDAGVRRG